MTRLPPRFAEVFQFDVWHKGTEVQRQAVRDALTPDYGTPHHRLLQRLDRQVNRGTAVDGTVYHGRSFLTVGIRAGMTAPGLASPAGFNLSAAMGRAGLLEVALHELGHVVDFWLLTDANRQWFQSELGRESWPGAWESWAEACREWIETSGLTWVKLTPILVGEGL